MTTIFLQNHKSTIMNQQPTTIVRICFSHENPQIQKAISDRSKDLSFDPEQYFKDKSPELIVFFIDNFGLLFYLEKLISFILKKGYPLPNILSIPEHKSSYIIYESTGILINEGSEIIMSYHLKKCQ